MISPILEPTALKIHYPRISVILRADFLRDTITEHVMRFSYDENTSFAVIVGAVPKGDD